MERFAVPQSTAKLDAPSLPLYIESDSIFVNAAFISALLLKWSKRNV